MRGLREILLLAGLALALPSTRAQDSAAEKALAAELKKLQGTWQVVRAETNGVKMPAPAFAKVRITIADDTMTFRDGAEVYDEVTLELNLKSTPRTVDAYHTRGLNKGRTELGIYQLKADELTLCLAPWKQKRPSEFSSAKNSGQQLYVLRRVAK